MWEMEHGKNYGEGIKPLFDSNKIRKYNSYWAWARQEAFALFYDTLRDNPAQFDSVYCKRVFSLTNRATPELYDLVKEIARKGLEEGNSRIARHISNLAEQVHQHIDSLSVFRLLNSNHDG